MDFLKALIVAGNDVMSCARPRGWYGSGSGIYWDGSQWALSCTQGQAAGVKIPPPEILKSEWEVRTLKYVQKERERKEVPGVPLPVDDGRGIVNRDPSEVVPTGTLEKLRDVKEGS